jgi:two-component system KDP operon response regulator KdpE
MERGPRILIADDDAGIRIYLRRLLTSHGYDTSTASNGQLVTVEIKRQCPAGIILGLNLADQDGLALIRAIRLITDVPLLVLIEDRGAGPRISDVLDSGAQDCLSKPFAVEDLLARLRHALRRQRASGQKPVVRTCGLEMDTVHRKVLRDGREVHLSPYQWQVLSRLLEADGGVIPGRDIAMPIWGARCRTGLLRLRSVIRALRKKIEADPATPAFILTQPRVGYRFRVAGINGADVCLAPRLSRRQES